MEDIEIELQVSSFFNIMSIQTFSKWHRKENDLYSLYQTDDFKSLDAAENPSLFSLRFYRMVPRNISNLGSFFMDL